MPARSKYNIWDKSSCRIVVSDNKEMIYLVRLFDIVIRGDEIMCRYEPEHSSQYGLVSVSISAKSIVSVTYS